MPATYDEIGINYSDLRKPDVRIAATIDEQLGSARTVLNVGAGAGSYEPISRLITAVEPSSAMIAQRPESSTEVIQGIAEDLPFDDNRFDASMAILTVHHWTDKAKGLREMRRVTRGPCLVLTFDPAFHDFWLTDYLPELVTLDEGQTPSLSDYERWMGQVEISPVLIPHDCSDGFLAAYWRRPSAYLDPRIRAAISSFWMIGDMSEPLSQLEQDIESGVWLDRYGHLSGLDACDCGYRLVVTR